MLLGSTCYNDSSPFFWFTLTPTTTVVCFRWVWSVVVLCLTYSTFCIVLVTAAVVVTNSWVNPLSRYECHVITVYLVLSRFSVGGVLYLTCIPSPLAWWREHDITSIAKWHGQESSWLLAIWHSPIAKSLLSIWQFCIVKALLTIWRSNVAKCMLAIWGHPIAKQ